MYDPSPTDPLHAPMETPPTEEISPEEFGEFEQGPARKLDPALVYFVLMVVVLLGLNSFAPEVRYTIVWAAMTIFAVLSIIADKVTVSAPTMTELVAGVGLGLLVGVPLVGIGAALLQQVSVYIFGKSPDVADVAVFQTLVFTMPLAEGLFFRVALQSARGAVFTALAAGFWSIALFGPQLNVKKAPPVAVVIGLAFVFANAIYSYARHRFGVFASWACQIVINLLLLFAVRFVALS